MTCYRDVSERAAHLRARASRAPVPARSHPFSESSHRPIRLPSGVTGATWALQGAKRISNRRRPSKVGRKSGARGGSGCRRERSGTSAGVCSGWRWRYRAKHTKGAALVIPLLPPRARVHGAVKLPHAPVDRLFIGVPCQGCAAPVLPFDGTVELFRRAGSAAPDTAKEEGRVIRSSTLPELCRSRCRIARRVRISWKNTRSGYGSDVP